MSDCTKDILTKLKEESDSEEASQMLKQAAEMKLSISMDPIFVSNNPCWCSCFIFLLYYGGISSACVNFATIFVDLQQQQQQQLYLYSARN